MFEIIRVRALGAVEEVGVFVGGDVLWGGVCVGV